MKEAPLKEIGDAEFDAGQQMGQAPRSPPAGDGSKPPRAASVKSRSW